MLEKAEKIIGRKIRIAIVGCGRISKNHIKAIEVHHERAELVAICDNNESNLSKTDTLLDELSANNSLFKGKPIHFKSYSDLLRAHKEKTINIDLIVLATPSGIHPAQVIAAAGVGLHVCTEKPMATRWADGLAMVKACDQASVFLFVVKQNRFNKTLQLVKDQLLRGRFGRLALVTSNVFWQRPQNYYDQDDWRGTWEFDGGALMNQASHYVDLLDWLIGPVDSLNASIATIGRNIEVEDTAAIKLKWRNGCLGTMAVTMLTYPKNLEGSITILGEKGTVRIGGPAVNEIEEWMFADKHEDDRKIKEVNYETTSVYGFGHPPYYANLIDTLQGIDKPICDGREGLRSLELVISAYRSARDGSTVHLPLEY